MGPVEISGSDLLHVVSYFTFRKNKRVGGVDLYAKDTPS